MFSYLPIKGILSIFEKCTASNLDIVLQLLLPRTIEWQMADIIQIQINISNCRQWLKLGYWNSVGNNKSVINQGLFWGGGGYVQGGWYVQGKGEGYLKVVGTHPPQKWGLVGVGTHPVVLTSSDSHRSRQYASYWNVFLLICMLSLN